MASFFIKFLINEGVYVEEKLNYEFGSKSRLSKISKIVDLVKSIPVVKEVLNPKT